MSHIFSLKDLDNFSEKLDLDELYEKKHQSDLNKLNLFNKILNRAHIKIKTTSRLYKDLTYCWFLIPEVMIGVPKYDSAECIAYIINKLEENKLNIKYFHPNLILISWQHWIPGYIRSEYKKTTGETIDGLGQNVTKEKNKEDNLDNLVLNQKQKPKQNEENFKSINSYKPIGNFIYNNDMINKITENLK